MQDKGGRRDLWLGRAGLSVRLLPLALLCLTQPGPCLTHPRQAITFTPTLHLCIHISTQAQLDAVAAQVVQVQRELGEL